MSRPARRVVFNPTSLPELRTHRNHFHTVRTIRAKPLSAASYGIFGRIRNESTSIGKNHSGHIETQNNEGVLFFDSRWLRAFGIAHS
jgi:hypothetical protein